jgi:hypothetical protein
MIASVTSTSANPSEFGLFATWVQRGFTSELIPIAPWDAKDPQGNPMTGRGKCPARKVNDEAWLPMKRWQTGGWGKDDIREWAAWGGNVGLLARQYPACDIDVLEPEIADAIQRSCFEHLGVGPVRRGNDPKRLIAYRGGISKRKLSFSLPDGSNHTVEFLGRGQQFVVDGVHPKTERPYRWDEDQRPTIEELISIDQEQVDSWLKHIESWLTETYGAVVIGRSRPSSMMTPADQAKLDSFAAQITDGGGFDAFIEQFERPDLRADAKALLESSEAVRGIRDGVELHDSTVRFGRDAAWACLSEVEAIALCDLVMREGAHHPEWKARHEDMPRCVRDGYRNAIADMTYRGIFHDAARFWTEISAAEKQFHEGAPEVMRAVAGFDIMPTTAEQLDGFARLRIQRAAANDNAASKPPGAIMRPMRRDLMSTITRRQWLYGSHYVRGFVTATVAPGGSGKSSLVLAECVAIALGRSLLGHEPQERARVFYFNGEDPIEETERRLAGVIQHYDIDPADLEGRFFYASGRDSPLLIAKQDRTGQTITEPILDKLIAEGRAQGIGLIVVDPFVSTHGVSENDNGAIDAVVKRGWGRVAQELGCAVELVHHTRKTYGVATTAEDGRGAVALHAAARSVRTLNRPTRAECPKLAIPEESVGRYLRLERGKANMAPPDKGEWYFLSTEPLDAIDARDGEIGKEHVAVAERWYPPEVARDNLRAHEVAAVHAIIAGQIQGSPWRAHEAANDWAGHAIEAVLLASRGSAEVNCAKPQLRAYLDWLLSHGIVSAVKLPDRSRKPRPCIVASETWNGGQAAGDQEAVTRLTEAARRQLFDAGSGREQQPMLAAA